MEAFETRVVAEAKELDKKLSALVAFFRTEIFAQLSPARAAMMVQQSVAMAAYSHILRLRIADFGHDQL